MLQHFRGVQTHAGTVRSETMSLVIKARPRGSRRARCSATTDAPSSQAEPGCKQSARMSFCTMLHGQQHRVDSTSGREHRGILIGGQRPRRQRDETATRVAQWLEESPRRRAGWLTKPSVRTASTHRHRTIGSYETTVTDDGWCGATLEGPFECDGSWVREAAGTRKTKFWRGSRPQRRPTGPAQSDEPARRAPRRVRASARAQREPSLRNPSATTAPASTATAGAPARRLGR